MSPAALALLVALIIGFVPLLVKGIRNVLVVRRDLAKMREKHIEIEEFMAAQAKRESPMPPDNSKT